MKGRMDLGERVHGLQAGEVMNLDSKRTQNSSFGLCRSAGVRSGGVSRLPLRKIRGSLHRLVTRSPRC